MPRYDANGQPIVERRRPRPRQMRSIDERLEDPNEGVRAQAREQSRSGARYDRNGQPITPAPYTAQEQVSDFFRSIPGGVATGVAAIPGVRGDVAEMRGQLRDSANLPQWAEAVDDVAQSIVDPLYPVQRAVGAMMGRESPPTTEDYRSGIESVTGELHEPETTAGEYGRTLGEFAPGALIPVTRANQAVRGVVQRGASMLGRGARQVTTQAVAPALASESLGQAAEGTDLEVPARIVGALLGAGVSEGSIQLLTRQGLTPDERALRLIRRELANAGYSAEEITRVANRLIAQAPTEEVLGELMGPSGQRLMRATAAMGQGSGRSTAENVLNARALGREGPARSPDPNRRGVTSIRERVTREAARTFEPEQTRAPRNYWDHIDTLRRARQGQAAENYRTAYGQGIDQGLVQEHLAPLMVEAPDAARSAARQLEFEERRLLGQRSQLATSGSNDAEALARIETDLADVRAAREQLAAIAEGQAPRVINTRAIDYFQRGLQQAEQTAGRGSPEAGAIASFRHGFNGLADQIAPALGDTRSQYGRSMAVEDLTELGRRVFNMSEGEIDRALKGPNGRGLTVEEFDGFQLGVLDAIESKLGQGDTGFLARLARNENWRSQLIRAAGGEREARRFMDRLAREAAMQRTRNTVLSGSPTARIQEDIRALTTGESEFGFLADEFGGVQGFVQRVSAGAKNPMDASMRIVTWLWDRYNRPGIANPQVQQAMAQRLFARVTRESSKELRDALMTVPDNRSVHPTLRAFVRALLAAQGGGEDGEEAPTPAPQPSPERAAEIEDTAPASIIQGADGQFYANGRPFETYEEAEAYARAQREGGGYQPRQR